MKVEFLTGGKIESALSRLMLEYDEFFWAVAWGTLTPLADELLSHSEKFKALTFGLAFAQTDPDFVDKLIDIEGCFVASRFPGGTFHPKVYAFRTAGRAAAIIGSANFTRGGMSKNLEAALLITGSSSDDALAKAIAFAKQSTKFGESVTELLAKQYRLSHKLAARMPKPPHNPLKMAPANSLTGLSSPMVGMDWGQYAAAIHASKHHDVDESLDLLRTAQTWLSGAPSFRNLSGPQRKAIAGIIGKKDKTSAQLNRNWGWFGSMKGAGDFKNRIAENDRWLARAVDSIPQRGDVTREHFERFVRLFLKAFDDSQRTGGVATASRLLAMKRPDVFLCISNPNISAAAEGMAFAKSTLKLDNYWGRVVEAMRASDWYNAEKPDTSDGQLWECRAAMLDAIYYRPGS